jgi:glycerol-1-phosphate dehydrogenase [NAD(P)+]
MSAGPRGIAIPRLLEVRANCLDGVAALSADAGFDTTRVCVGSGVGPSVAFADRVVSGLRGAGLDVIESGGLAGGLEQAADLAGRVIAADVTLLVAVGGGRVIDTVKLAAGRTGTEFISVPTAISHDGISSPVASLTPEGGARRSYAAAMPAGVIVDVDVIGSAPERTLRAGVGDLVSNLTALMDWRRAAELGHTRFDAFSAMIAESAALPALDLERLDRPEDQELIAKGLLMSGLAMAAAGTSRPCSGAEHLISHSLDQERGAEAAMHGEQVALGALVAAAAHRSPLREALMVFFAQLGLPTSPGDLGLDTERLRAAVRSAPATRPDRYTILTDVAGDDEALSSLIDRAFLPAE